jgi:hypothetical protein
MFCNILEVIVTFANIHLFQLTVRFSILKIAFIKAEAFKYRYPWSHHKSCLSFRLHSAVLSWQVYFRTTIDVPTETDTNLLLIDFNTLFLRLFLRNDIKS